MLKLDDYLNQTFFNASISIHLYIGYYLTAEKIGAAHDPLVCFPGQGWTIRDRKKDNLDIAKGINISYTSMVVEREKVKNLILYWFQADDKTNSNTFQQKINLIASRLMGRGEENAFVRISTEVGDRSVEDVRQAQLDFVKAFYPHFIRYIDGMISEKSVVVTDG